MSEILDRIIDEEEEEEEEPEDSTKTLTLNNEWILERKRYIERLEKLKLIKTSDRLELFAKFLETHCMISESVEGWGDWVKTPFIFVLIPQKELEELVFKYIDAVQAYLQADILGTELVEKFRDKSNDCSCSKKHTSNQPYTV